MSRRRRVYEGKAKVLYEGPEPGTLVQHFKDDATAFNNQKRATIEGKGVLNNRISEFIFTRLNEIGVPTHFIRAINMREQLIQMRIAADPSLTPLIVAVEQSRQSASGLVPPVFWWYHHAGYKDVWERQDWHDPSMKRPFAEYFQEASDSGWWSGVDVPRKEHPTRVIIEMGGNVLRRTRGGSKMLLEKLWPQLTCVATLEVRMSTTALYSDYVLPCAQWYEKIGFGIPSTHVMHLTFSDKAVDPPGEAVDEWEAYRRLAEKVQERARARGIKPYLDARGVQRDPANAHDNFTKRGMWVDQEVIADEMIRDSAVTGTLPADASLQDIREKGFYRWQGAGINPRMIAQATQPRPDETFVPFRDHIEAGRPTRRRSRGGRIPHRASVVHSKRMSISRGTRTLRRWVETTTSRITSGHNRWSIHSLNNASQSCSTPTGHAAPGDEHGRCNVARNRGQRHGGVHNGLESFQVPVLLSPRVLNRPGGSCTTAGILSSSRTGLARTISNPG